jgi:metallophosphoesterase (TIGR00282 family)
LKILMVGDAVGRPGRRAAAALLPKLRRELEIDLIIANGENAAAGRGLTLGSAEEILAAGVDIITSGNHIWDQKEIVNHLDGALPILRPLNYPPNSPGRGVIEQAGVTVINLQGRVFMANIDCPFRAADEVLANLPGESIIIVDMHAEATSEKVAMGWYLDGRVSAVLGTHTHVATADTRILPQGTAFVCDVGMTGALDSVIGDDVDCVIRRFLTGMPVRLEVASGPALILNSVLMEVDEGTGRAQRIERIDRELVDDQ